MTNMIVIVPQAYPLPVMTDQVCFLINTVFLAAVRTYDCDLLVSNLYHPLPLPFLFSDYLWSFFVTVGMAGLNFFFTIMSPRVLMGNYSFTKSIIGFDILVRCYG